MLEEVINLKDEYQQAIVMMGDSGIAWIDLVFRVCVILLVEFAKIIGITYEELNVFLFVITFPAVIIISLTLNVVLVIKLSSAKKRLQHSGTI